MKKTLSILFCTVYLFLCFPGGVLHACAEVDTLRTMRYTSRSKADAIAWQDEIRSKLFNLLKISDLFSDRKHIAIKPKEIRIENKGLYILKEVEINSTSGRRIKVVITFPKQSGGQFPAVVCIHGHGGEMRSVYDKKSIYKGFADVLASSGYITITAFVSQHQVYEAGRILMGERLWDLIRCVDYLETLEEVDKNRIGCAGLSLGGEMAMWLGAMDTRIKATVSAGFLTEMDHMEQNHCMCWKFPGLRELVDFADIYSLIAPRPLLCQNGLQEPLTQFNVPLARKVRKEIEVIYRDFDRPENMVLDVHNGGHEIHLPDLINFIQTHLNKPD